MNKVILIARATKDATVNDARTVARYTLAVDRFGEGTDFIDCVCFGKQVDFAEKFIKKGIKIAVEGRIQTGSYEKDGMKIKTTDVVVERHEFCESKSQAAGFSVINANIDVENVPDESPEYLPFD